MMLKRYLLWAVCLVSIGSLYVNTGCKKHNEVTGCTDSRAANYDAKATVNSGCRYAVDAIAGTYRVTDTQVVFHHNDTTGWYDTATSQFTIKAIAYTHDSLDFDTVLCIHCHSGYLSIAPDLISYYYTMDNLYYVVGGRGVFSGDTLRYSDGVSPMTSEGASKRWGVGIKQH